MSTLAEIERAIASLPAPEQQALYRQLGARLDRSPAPLAVNKRQAVEQFLERWTGAGTGLVTEAELQARRTARLLEKHVN